MKTTSKKATDSLVRLQKFLARGGVASRRASEKLIVEGHVCINGQIVTELGVKIDPEKDEVTVDGKRVVVKEKPVVLMLNKPAGYLTSMKDDRQRPCVAQLVPLDTYPGLFPIGRLDFDTTGLLLFTTDGELGNALCHPSFHVDKEYHALVKGHPSRASLSTLEKGVLLKDGLTAPARVSVLKQDKTSTLLSLTIHEGKKRQVKRMCEAVGHPVIRLHRAQFGPLSLGKLAEGDYRVLSEEEVAQLRSSIG